MPLLEEYSKEHYRKLYNFQDKILGFFASVDLPFYLGGGTALSRFHYQHRYSDDLDFFIVEDADFIQSVQRVHELLEEKGYGVSTYGFSQHFARFSIADRFNDETPQLKVDFIHQRSELHIGDFKAVSLFHRIDNPKNILAEKLSFIHKQSPKDVADIWIICRNLSFSWEEVIIAANRKRTTDPLFAADILKNFEIGQLEKVRWISPVNLDDFSEEREIIIKDIVTNNTNRLVTLEAL